MHKWAQTGDRHKYTSLTLRIQTGDHYNYECIRCKGT